MKLCFKRKTGNAMYVGKRLVQLAALNNLRVINTVPVSPIKKIHKGTRTIPDTTEYNQIDHVITSIR